MNDHFSMIAHIIQKLLANPAKVRKRLFFERNTGADARVNKGIAPDFNYIFAVAQKFHMLGWHKLRQAFSHFGETCIGQVVIPGPIASYRRLSADPHEIPQTSSEELRVGKEGVRTVK